MNKCELINDTAGKTEGKYRAREHFSYQLRQKSLLLLGIIKRVSESFTLQRTDQVNEKSDGRMGEGKKNKQRISRHGLKNCAHDRETDTERKKEITGVMSQMQVTKL